jgi:hypothetical protein
MGTQQTDRLAGLIGDFGIKTPVKVATTAAITLSGAQTIDGIAVSANTSPTPPDRVLVKNQSDQTTNGIYDVQSGTWARAKDFDGARDAKTGTLVYVVSGSTNGGHLFKCTSADPIRIGTDAITFADASVTGPAGADGAPGSDGADGADGAPGADGATGATGATGAGANIIVTDGSTTVNPASTLRLGAGFTVTDSGSGEAQVDGGSGSGLIGIQFFKTAGTSTYTPTVGTASVIIYLAGAGAGGGGAAANPGAGAASWGTGGQGGAWLQKYLTSNFSGKQIVIGAKGTGGAAGANDGTAGGNSTFDAAGANYIAHGGVKGGGGKGPVGNYALQGGGEGTPATASNGDLNIDGQIDSVTFSLGANSTGVGGTGGSSPWGRGGTGGSATGGDTGSAGSAATGNGTGGGGAMTIGASIAAKAGGDGTDGICIIYEYS